MTGQILLALAGNDATIVFDAISDKETQEVGLQVTAPGGVFVVTGSPFGDKDAIPKKHIYKVVGIVHKPQLRDFGHAMYAQLPKLLEEGKIKVSKS